MTQGAWTRCNQKGCRKKADEEIGLCPIHLEAWTRNLLQSNPNMVRLVKAVVVSELWDRGLIDA